MRSAEVRPRYSRRGKSTRVAALAAIARHGEGCGAHGFAPSPSASARVPITHDSLDVGTRPRTIVTVHVMGSNEIVTTRRNQGALRRLGYRAQGV